MRATVRAEPGFTLIEILVVILIIAILAAIALPTFLGQREKAHDTSAKTGVRNAISQMEACLIDDPYARCVADPASLQDAVTAEAGGSATSYTLTKFSDSSVATDFHIAKAGPGVFSRTCGSTVQAGKGRGACPTSGVW